MTVVAVMADPPRPGLVLPELARTSPLTPEEAADLYAAMLQDAIDAVARSGGELLVNYRPDDLLPAEHVTDTDAEAAVRALVAPVIPDIGEVRFEPQVGSTESARAGNTATHLLREEGVQSAAIVRGNAPFLTRSAVDSAAMKLRSSEVVLGPGTRGDIYYAGFTDTVDFASAFEPPATETLTDLARAEGHGVDFLPMAPTVERGADLATLLPYLNARIDAERIVPTRTATALHEVGLETVVEDGEVGVARRES